MPENIPIRNGQIVDSLTEFLQEGKAGLEHVPALLVRVVNEEMWRERFVKTINTIVCFASFTAFVNASPPEGLGCDVRLLQNLCKDFPDALDAIDRATQQKPGRPPETTDNIQDSPAPSGTSKAAALRRLRKDRPDLHEQVVSGQTSANAAMVAAGFRKKLTRDEQAVAAVKKCESRLIVARVLIDACEPHERAVIRDWLEDSDQ